MSIIHSNGLAEFIVPSWERAHQAACRLSLCCGHHLYPGFQGAFRRGDEVIALLDRAGGQDVVGQLIQEHCSAVHVRCSIVPTFPDLVLDRGTMQLLGQEVSAERAAMSLVDHRYWVIVQYEANGPPSIRACPVTRYASRDTPARQALELVNRLGLQSLYYLINGKWVAVAAKHTTDDVVQCAPALETPQAVPRLARYLKTLFFGYQAGRRHPILGDFPARFDCQSVIEKLGTASACPLTGFLPAGFNFDEQGRPVIDMEQVHRGY